VPLRRDGAATPLVLVHPAGGHVFFYRHLVGCLPPGRPVWGVRALGLEEGEEPLPTVEAMAERYVAALRRMRPRGPYLVGGSSLGGSVAYAMARLLAAAGEAVPAVVQIDTFGPGQMPELAVVAPPRADDAGGYELARVEAVARAGTQAMFAYRPPPFAGRLVYFRATLRGAGEPTHPERPWLDVAAGGVDFEVLPGGHLSVHRPPHVERLAARLAAALARAEAAGIDRERTLVDPGLGFAKAAAHNFALLARLPVLAELGRPILVGASRKSFLGGAALGLAGPQEETPAGRLAASLAAAAWASQRGAAVLRVHDVAETVAALAAWRRLAEVAPA
jgi:thioesterase domain-containing protein